MNLIDSGKKDGASLVAGGNRVGDRGYFVEPTVFANVNDNMRIATEEVILCWKSVDLKYFCFANFENIKAIT